MNTCPHCQSDDLAEQPTGNRICRTCFRVLTVDDDGNLSPLLSGRQRWNLPPGAVEQAHKFLRKRRAKR